MISNTIPKISCIVLSDKTPDQSFVDGFLNQNYPNKELVALIEDLSLIDDNFLFVQRPNILSVNEQKDLKIELTTGDLNCWWEAQDDEYWLTRKYKHWCEKHEDDDVFFSKVKFHKAGNMLYSGTETEIDHDYF